MKSKETVEGLIKSIKSCTGLTQEQIADRIKYKREYLSQAKKTDSPKLISLLKTAFKEELDKVQDIDEEDVDETGKSEILKMLKVINANLIETRHVVELNEALARANLFQVAKLESLATRAPHRSILEGLNAVVAKIFDEIHPELTQTNG